eukprot:5247937-Ditylum_brightwellii.AAC.1
MSMEKIARDEIQKLTSASVLGKGPNSPWGAPRLFQGKKDGGIQFLTDLCKVNEAILPPPPSSLLNTNDVILKMQGFTFVTCLDLNWGYYYFALDDFAQHLCSIILP